MPATAQENAAIDAVIARFYAAFDNRGGRRPTLESVTGCLHPRATVARWTGTGFELMDPTAFAAPRVALLASGELQDFHEWETEAQTQVAGALASRQSRYAKAGLKAGSPYAGGGRKSFQLIREQGEWRILGVTWQDDPS